MVGAVSGVFELVPIFSLEARSSKLARSLDADGHYKPTSCRFVVFVVVSCFGLQLCGSYFVYHTG